MKDRHLFRVGRVSGVVVWSGPRKLSIRLHPRACMRVVEMSEQAPANAQTGRAGVAITNATGSQPRSGGVKPNFACKLQLYLCETSVDLGIVHYSQRFVGERLNDRGRVKASPCQLA